MHVQTSWEQLGIRLRQWRSSQEKTQEQVAAEAGISVRTLIALENGTSHAPRSITLQLLADVLGLCSNERNEILQLGKTTTPPPPLLPQPQTTLIGRESTIDQLLSLLQQEHVRLLTLIGPAGVGKTRVALAIAHRLAQDVTTATYFISLAHARTAQHVAQAIAQIMHIPERAKTDLWDTLRGHLQARTCTLVLDNCEHILFVAPYLAKLLAACPHVQCLSTSRAPLQLAGEYRFLVSPLPVPDPAHPIEQLQHNPAIYLFLQRAQAQDPTIAFTAANASAIVALCRRADGLPLAIELTAAQCMLLSPQDILAHMDTLDLTSLILSDTYASLRTAIAWSYNLLTPPQQRLFRCLGVFADGASLEGVQSLTSDLAMTVVFEGLRVLVNNSLLYHTEGEDGRSRVQMLETIRAYALEQMTTGGEADVLRQAHAMCMRDFAEKAAQQLTGADQHTWYQRLQDESANMHQALDWFLQQKDDTHGLQLAGALWRFWEQQGTFAEGSYWLSALLALGDSPSPERAKAWFALGVMARRQGDNSVAHEALEHALTLSRQSQHTQAISAIISEIGTLLQDEGAYAQAEVYFTEALHMSRESGDLRNQAVCLGNLGAVAMDRGIFTQAHALYAESLALIRSVDDQRTLAFVLTNLADTFIELGELSSARIAAEEGLAIRRDIGDQRGIAVTLSTLGWLCLHENDDVRAYYCLAESLSLFRQVNDRQWIASVLWRLGALFHAHGVDSRARACYWESLRICQSLGTRQNALPVLIGYATIYERLGQHGRSAKILGLAVATHEHVHMPIVPSLQATYVGVQSTLRSTMGSEQFQLFFEQGRLWSWEEAIISILADGKGMEESQVKDIGISL